MKRMIRINYFFWKEGPLLFDVAHIVPALVRESKLPRLLAKSNL
jgi:hypothetical protein